MAQEKEESSDNTIVGAVFDAIQTPGNMLRQTVAESLRLVKGSDYDFDKVWDNFTKERKATPDVFLDFLSQETGLDKMVIGGTLGGLVGGAVSGLNPIGMAVGALIGSTSEFGQEIATDFATDPIALISRPMKFLKGGKTTAEAIAKVKAGKGVLGKTAKLAGKQSEAIEGLRKVAEASGQLAKVNKALEPSKKLSLDMLKQSKKEFAKRSLINGLSRSAQFLTPRNTDELARMSTGALLGTLSIDADDDLDTIAQKIIGTSIAGKYSMPAINSVVNGVAVPEALRPVTQAAFKSDRIPGFNDIGSMVADSFIHRRYNKVFSEMEQSLIKEYGEDRARVMMAELTPTKIFDLAKQATSDPKYFAIRDAMLEAEQKLEADAYYVFAKKVKDSVANGTIKQDILEFVQDKVSRMTDSGELGSFSIIDEKDLAKLARGAKIAANQAPNANKQDAIALNEFLTFRKNASKRKNSLLDSYLAGDFETFTANNVDKKRLPSTFERKLQRTINNDPEAFKEFLVMDFYQQRGDWFGRQAGRREKIRKKLLESAREQGYDITSKFEAQANQDATMIVNVEAARELKRLNDINPQLAYLLEEVADTNKQLVGKYNAHWKKIYGDDFDNVVPFNFWTYDMQAAERTADIISSSSAGFKQRLSDKVIPAISKQDRAIGREMAANMFAGRFLSAQEQNARKMVGRIIEEQVTKAKNLKPVKQRAKDLVKLGFSKKEALSVAQSERAGDFFLDGYDKFLGLHKSIQLAVSATWAKTNLIDNTINAYLVGGLDTAGRAFFDTTVGAAGSSASYVLKKLKLNEGAKVIDNIMKNNRYYRIAQAFSSDNPEQMRKYLDFKDPMLNLARNFGAVSGTRYTDFRASAIGDEGAMAALLRAEGKDQIAKEFLTKSGLDKATDFIWNLPTAKFGNYAEQSMRYMVWEENMKALADVRYPTKRNIDGVRMTLKELMKKNPKKFADLANEIEGANVEKLMSIKQLDSLLKGKEVADTGGLKRYSKIFLDNTAEGKALKNDYEAWQKFEKSGVKSKRKVFDMYKDGKDISRVNQTAASKSRQAAVRDAKKLARDSSDTVKQIFFDYDNVSQFENLVMKRIFPYWTFWTRNFGKFANLTFDPEGFTRITGASKLVNNMGSPLSKDDEDTIPDYFLDKRARLVDTDKYGRKIVRYAPSFAFIDFLNNLRLDTLSDVGSKMSPMVKLPFEQVSGYDLFRKRRFVPEDSSQAVRVFDNSVTAMMSNKTLEKMGAWRNPDSGEIMTDSETFARTMNAIKNIVPVPPITDQIERLERDVKFKLDPKETGSAILEDILSPFKVSRVSEESQAFRQRAVMKQRIGEELTTQEKAELKGKLRRRKKGQKPKRRRRQQ